MNQAVKIIRAIMTQLAPIHARGRALCSLSPKNVGVDQSGGAVSVLLPPLEGGVVSTSAHCASPERVRGAPEGPPSDVYASGVLLYHMISGMPPFEGDTPDAILEQHLNRPPPPLAESELQDVPEHLERLVQRMLDKQPESRPHAGEIIEIIDNLELDSTVLGMRLQGVRELARAVAEAQEGDTDDLNKRPEISPLGVQETDPFADTFIRNRADFGLDALPSIRPSGPADQVDQVGPDPGADGYAATKLSIPQAELPKLPPGPIKVVQAADTQILNSDDLTPTDKPAPSARSGSSGPSEQVGKIVFAVGVGLLVAALLSAAISMMS